MPIYTGFLLNSGHSCRIAMTRIFVEKHMELAGLVIRDIKIYSQNEAQAQCIRYTQRFLRGRWRTEEGVYINKEQRCGCGSSFFTSSVKWQVSFIPTRPPITYVNLCLVDYW